MEDDDDEMTLEDTNILNAILIKEPLLPEIGVTRVSQRKNWKIFVLIF